MIPREVRETASLLHPHLRRFSGLGNSNACTTWKAGPHYQKVDTIA
jgi:hypothetical protein